jgi:hypothetical protein
MGYGTSLSFGLLIKQHEKEKPIYIADDNNDHILPTKIKYTFNSFSA